MLVLPGRRAYEKHFKEFRHQNGMRALGIPNNKNFYEVRARLGCASDMWPAWGEHWPSAALTTSTPTGNGVRQVTKIEDAKKLWAEIQLKQVGGFKAETEEEFEDSAGNVYNKRTYLDLKKQGLI